MVRRFHDFFLGRGLLAQTKHWHVAQMFHPFTPKWRWRLARRYYTLLVGFRKRSGYYRRRQRAATHTTAEKGNNVPS